VLDWYPNNAVLRALTPREQCRPLEVRAAAREGGLGGHGWGRRRQAAAGSGRLARPSRQRARATSPATRTAAAPRRPASPAPPTPTPPTPGAQIYPVKLAQEAVYVDVTQGASVRRDKGGAGTALENNNVFTVQPTVYFEGMDPRCAAAAAAAAAGPAGRALLAAAGRRGACQGCCGWPLAVPAAGPLCPCIARPAQGLLSPLQPASPTSPHLASPSPHPAARFEEASLYQVSSEAEKPNPVVALTATVALGIIAVAGTATAIYYEVRAAWGLPLRCDCCAPRAAAAAAAAAESPPRARLAHPRAERGGARGLLGGDGQHRGGGGLCLHAEERAAVGGGWLRARGARRAAAAAARNAAAAQFCRLLAGLCFWFGLCAPPPEMNQCFNREMTRVCVWRGGERAGGCAPCRGNSAGVEQSEFVER
jgi:hypothetical protein